MNYFALIYPIASMAIFFSVFIAPQFAIFVIMLAPLLLLKYLELASRNKYSDIITIIIFLSTSFLGISQSVWYLVIIALPITFLAYWRKSDKRSVYVPAVFAPLPAALSVAVVVAFFPTMREEIYKLTLESINYIVAPLENTQERFGDYGAYTYFIANKELSANYITMMLPSISFLILSGIIFLSDRVVPVVRNYRLIVRDFRLPDGFVWVFIAGGFLILAPDKNLKFVSYNILVIFGLLYFYQGFQILSILLDRWKISRFMRGLGYVLLLSEPPVALFLSIAGLFSIWIKPKWSLREEEKDAKK